MKEYKHPLVSIVMVSYNSAPCIEQALSSIYDETKQISCEIIVVDNASKDDTVIKIRDAFPRVRLICSPNNIGFGRGVNLGVAQAKGKFLLLINPDAVVLDDAIERLIDFATGNPGNGIWAGITLNNDMSLNSEHAWTKPGAWGMLFFAFGLNRFFPRSRLFNQINYGGWRRDRVRDVDIVSGCFFLTTRAVWDKLSGFDPAFFLYAEEADFCLRAGKCGCRPIVTPDARVIHEGGACHQSFSDRMIPLLKGKVELINRHVADRKQSFYKFLLFLYVANNHMRYWLLAPRSEKRQQWSIVFRKRKEWLRGYTR